MQMSRHVGSDPKSGRLGYGFGWFAVHTRQVSQVSDLRHIMFLKGLYNRYDKPAGVSVKTNDTGWMQRAYYDGF